MGGGEELSCSWWGGRSYHVAGGGVGGRIGGQEPGRKSTGSVQEVGKEGTRSRIHKVAGRGRKRKNYTTLQNILQSKKGKVERQPKKDELGFKGKGNGKFRPSAVISTL